MIPGMTYWPFASITVAPSGVATWGPISAILPSRMRTDPLGRAGRETGRMKASFMIKTPDAGDRCGSEARSQAAHDARTIVAIKAVFFIRIIPACCGLRIEKRRKNWGFATVDLENIV